MLARLQQITTFLLLLAASSWAAWFAAHGHPAWAVAGAVLIVFGYAIFLGAEFVMLAATQGDDPAPRAGIGPLLRAWFGEVVTAPRVFCWRQPFRSQAEPDWLPQNGTGRRGVVLVHGFVCNRGLWNPWMQRLRREGVPHIAVTLEPVFGSIDDCTPAIAQAVHRLHASSGLAPVIVAHSMGGLAARAWLRAAVHPLRVHRVVTIGTPHQGTWLARFATTLNGRQMRQGSDWLAALSRDELRKSPETTYAGFTCFFSHCDNIVFPPSVATLPGADNRHLSGSAHVHLAYHDAVYSEVLRAVAADPAAPAGLPTARQAGPSAAKPSVSSISE
jgi:triacylglycerol esterase/lipase EstA (alpha/beta hydrolase family)